MSPAHSRPRPADALPTAPTDRPLPQPRTPAPALGAGLRRIVLALTRAHHAHASGADRARRRPPDVDPPGSPESRERLAGTGDRPVWVAQDAAQVIFAGEIAA
jgi:hypothetical protein